MMTISGVGRMGLTRVGCVAVLALVAGCSGDDIALNAVGGDTAVDPDAASSEVTTPTETSTTSDGLDPTIDTPPVSDPGGKEDAQLPDGVQTPDIAADATAADTADSADTTAPQNVCLAAPSAELMVKIMGPPGSRRGKLHAAVITSVTSIGGIYAGAPDTLTWEANGQSGTCVGDAPFFKANAITLKPGPNPVKITAKKGDKSASDTIVVTYNPQFAFDADPSVSPDMMWSGETTKVIVSVPLSSSKTVKPGSMKIWQVDKDANPVGDKPLGTLADNGNAATSCDEIDSDGVFGGCIQSLSCTGGQDVWVRVSADVLPEDGGSYTAYSAPVRIECAERLPKAECTAAHGVMKEARKQFDTAGGTAAGTAARDAVIAWLLQQSTVAEAGPAAGDGVGLWVRFKGGFLGALNLTPKEYRGGSTLAAETLARSLAQATSAPPANTIAITSKKAIVLAPAHADLASAGGDEAEAIASLLSNTTCPQFDVNGPLNDSKADLAAFRSQYLYGAIAIVAHGEAYYTGMTNDGRKGFDWEDVASQEVIWSGEAVDCEKFTTTNKTCSSSGGTTCPAGTECVYTETQGSDKSVTLKGVCVDRHQMDLRRGRTVLSDTTWGMTGPFMSRYAKVPYASALVYAGSCRSMYNGSMAAEYFTAGAGSVVGYADYVHNGFAKDSGVQLFKDITENKSVSGQAHFSVKPLQDPESPGACMRMFGANNLDVMNSNIINPSFETADLTGWARDGDGRVISQLGKAIPVHGKFMGLVSTGLGFTVQTGEIEQNFCIPDDKSTVKFYWKFYSEEFKEYCGSIFQDTFQATLSNDVGQITLVNVKVDDLCHYNESGCDPCPDPGTGNCQCGSQYVGLLPSDVSFDIGGVFNTQWQGVEKDIKALAGKGPVSLKFFATDQGDSIFDTVILFDAISFH